MQHGEFGLRTMFTLWIPLLQSLGAPLILFPFYWLTLGSLYLILTTIGTPSVTVGSTFGKTTISCLVTSTGSTLLDILMPWVAAFYSIT